MKYLLSILMLGSLFLYSPSSAEVYVGANKNKNHQSAEPSAGNKIFNEQPAKTDFVLDEDMKAFANNYYGNCLKQQHPILKSDNLKLLCACTAARIAKTMQLDQAKIMGTNTPEGLEARNFMMLNVYVPCMEGPTKVLLYQGCINDKNVSQAVKNDKQVCGCLSKSMSGYIQQHGPQYIQNSLAKDPSTIDPLGDLLASPQYLKAANQNLMQCLQKHELKH